MTTTAITAGDVADVGALSLLHHSVGARVAGFVSEFFIHFQGSYCDVLLFYKNCTKSFLIISVVLGVASTAVTIIAGVIASSGGSPAIVVWTVAVVVVA